MKQFRKELVGSFAVYITFSSSCDESNRAKINETFEHLKPEGIAYE